MSATWHGREPDVRCEWRSTHNMPVCSAPAYWSAHLASRHRWTPIALCDAHCELERPRNVRTTFQPLLRDPRVALCAILGMLGMLGIARADPKLYALLAGDAADFAVALDHVEEHALYERAWPRVEVAWLPVTGRHEHAWLPWRSGSERSLAMLARPAGEVRRCTCGVFEHEVDEEGPIVGLSRLPFRPGDSVVLHDGAREFHAIVTRSTDAGVYVRRVR